VRRLIAAGLSVALATGGYLALDVLDLAPGILTRDASRSPVPTSPPPPRATASRPPAALPSATPAPPLSPAGTAAPLPEPAALRARLAPLLAQPALGPSVGVTVRDAATGAHLLDVDADRPRVPASTVKLLTAAAVAATLDPEATLATRVVQGASAGEVVLVAGGDSLLSAGAGQPASVAGRAGLGDLATQVAAALHAVEVTSVRLRLDLTYAAGARYPPGWNLADVHAGYTRGVAMVGLAAHRPEPGRPSPADPESAVLRAFAAALGTHGVVAAVEPRSTWSQPAPAAAAELGGVESAPVGDLLALALRESDNALTESLARQAAVRSGRPATFAAAVELVTETVAGLGVDLTGVRLRDTSGLSAGQAVPARVLGDVLGLATTGRVPGLLEVVARLPVAGLDGTLEDRFQGPGSRPAAGIARAKTGTLTGSSGLAGTLVDRDGRVLTYVVLADAVPASAGTLAARAALDRFVAALATCGCR
jgi:D-alanyl-D-alanine carboxypeptidase/D-alanyl-D-alanine-endopeptidase (penicillin-binding protein 4)